MRTYTEEEIKDMLKGSKWGKEAVYMLQGVVYTMCGGGMIGRFAAEQPAAFYIDARVPKRPYKVKEIYQTVRVLKLLAEKHGFDTNNMPKMKDFPGCGVF